MAYIKLKKVEDAPDSVLATKNDEIKNKWWPGYKLIPFTIVTKKSTTITLYYIILCKNYIIQTNIIYVAFK